MSGPDIVALVDEGLGNISYLVGLGDGDALVVDPGRDPGPYLAEVERRGLRIAYAAETHLHADFVSGSRELAARGARVVAAGAAGLEHPHRGMVDGERIDVGGLSLEALATPGHTPEHLAYLLSDDARPVALFSGGSLLVGAVARTDLIASERTEALARSLWRSVQTRLLGLPDELPVFPTHGASSFCSAANGRPPSAASEPPIRCWPPPTRIRSSPGCSPGSAPSRPTSSNCATSTVAAHTYTEPSRSSDNSTSPACSPSSPTGRR